MPVARFAYSGSATKTQLSADITSASNVLTIDLTDNWPTGAPFPIVMEAGGNAEEKLLVTRAGNTLNVLQRGYDGTAALNHKQGAEVYVCFTAVEMDSFNRIASTPVAKGDLLVSDANGMLQRVPVGGPGSVLATDPAAGLGVAWVPGLPIGAVIPTAAQILTAGYLWCDGAAVSRTVYAALFAAIGTGFGPGDGSTTFNVPDLRGRFPVGNNAMQGAPPGGNDRVGASARGQAENGANHLLTVAEMPLHAHNGTTDTDFPDHDHNVIGQTDDQGAHAHNQTSQAVGLEFGPNNIFVLPTTGTTGPRGTTDVQGTHRHNIGFASQGARQRHQHNFTTHNTGGGATHNNTPPYLGLNYWIRAA